MKVVEKVKVEPRRVLEARQLGFQDDAAADVVAWINSNGGIASHSGTNVHVRTPMGLAVASPGDWIIRSDTGNFGLCKPNLFDSVYERVPDDAPKPAGLAGSSHNPVSEEDLICEALVREIGRATRWQAKVEAWSALMRVRADANLMRAEHERYAGAAGVGDRKGG